MNQVTKKISLIFSANILVALGGIVTSLLIPKIVDIESYASWKVFMLYFSFVGVVNLGVIDASYLKFGGRKLLDEKGKVSEYLIYVFLISSITSVIISVPLFFALDNVFLVLNLLLSSVLFNIVGYFKIIYNSFEEYKKAGILNIIHKWSFIAILGVLSITSSISLNYNTIIISFNMTLLLITLFLLRKYDFLSTICNLKLSNIPVAKKMIKNGSPLLLSNLIGLFLFQIDLFFVKSYFSRYDFAYYAFAVTILNIIIIGINSLKTLIFPYASRNKEMLITNFNKTFISIIIITLLLNPFILFLFKYLISNYLPQYIKSISFIEILILNIPAICFIKIILYNIYTSFRIQNVYFFVNLIGVFLSIVLNLIFLISFNNPIFIAYATVITYSILIVLNLVILQRKKILKNIYFNILIYIMSSTLSYYIQIRLS